MSQSVPPPTGPTLPAQPDHAGFGRAVALVLSLEGGYNSDPDDPGGSTNFGISQRSFPDEDIEYMTVDRACAIYRASYWDPISGDLLPFPIAMVLFDSAVNQGVHAAVSMLQLSVKAPADGVMGPVTRSAVMRHANNMPALVAEFAARRAVRYASNPNIGRFGLGWFRRLMTVVVEGMKP